VSTATLDAAQQPVSAQTQQSWEHADQVAALAQSAAARMTGRVPGMLKALLAAAIVKWTAEGLADAGNGAVGMMRLFDFRAWFAGRLTEIGAALPDPNGLVSSLERAMELGARQAVAEAAEKLPPGTTLTLDQVSLDRLASLRARRQQLGQDAAVLAQQARTRSQVQAAFALAQRQVTVTNLTVSDLVHEAAHSGIDQIAVAGGWQEILIGERNACARCQSFQGAIAEPPDFVFHPVLLGRWLSPADHLGLTLPFHLHERCRGRLVRADDPRVSSLMDPGSLASVLRREAKRSLALGLALPSESAALRRRAAQELLDRRGGAGLPKTVEARARRRIAAGKFTTRPDVVGSR
jgi:hypothetical protein